MRLMRLKGIFGSVCVCACACACELCFIRYFMLPLSGAAVSLFHFSCAFIRLPSSDFQLYTFRTYGRRGCSPHKRTHVCAHTKCNMFCEVCGNDARRRVCARARMCVCVGMEGVFVCVRAPVLTGLVVTCTHL